MLNYKTLDTIADAYIPALAIICLIIIARSLFFHYWRKAKLQTGLLLFSLIITYGLMFLDQQWALWPRFGLDYSTHSALAWVLIVWLVIYAKRLSLLWCLSLIGYFWLMHYQGYHTVADMITTVIAVSVLLPLALVFRKKLKL